MRKAISLEIMTLKTEGHILMMMLVIIMTTKYKVRTAHSIKSDNDVICFDYIDELTSDYEAISLELFLPDRNDGYVEIIWEILKCIGYQGVDKSFYYYGQLSPWIDDTKINRHKGFWGFKPYGYKSYKFLENKKEVILANGNKIKLFGYAKLFFNEMTDMVKTSSYKDRGFYFYMSESFFDEDEFVSIIKKDIFGKTLDYVLSKGAIVFILLGDEEYKSSEIVAFGDANEIEMIRNIRE